MARKSRRSDLAVAIGKKEKSSIAALSQKQKLQAGIYGRLSIKDLGQEDGDTMETQIALLRDYVLQHPDLELREVYIDNGWTGTNFQRPEFNHMLEDIQAGKINCVVVKDLSRFGRSYWETGYYLEVLLPQLKTRFISVSDGFDSMTSDPGNLAIILKNILNDFYSRDLSRRFCDSYDLRKAEGVFRKGEPYGYMYDPEHPKHLTFDPGESYYVRMIFIWALEGVSSTVIARRLRDMKAPVPPSNEYQRPSLIEADDPQRWSITMVNTILKNRIYTGDFICGKSCRRKCDPFNYRPKIPQEEWVSIPKSHPAYITHEEYDQIARRMNEYSNRRNHQIRQSALEYERNPNIYRSKLVCPVCGGMMSAALAKRNQPANRLHYVCFREASRVQKTHYLAIRKQMLDMIVLNQLQAQCQLARLLSSWLHSPDGKQKSCQQIETYQKSLNQSKLQYDNLMEERTILFENHAEYIINEEDYAEAMSRLRDKLQQASKQMEEAAKQLTTMQTAMTSSNPWLKLFSAVPYPNEMNASLVQKTIDRILVRSEDDAEVIFLHQEFFSLIWRAYKETLTSS